MANYRRLISYIYAYEGGIKGKNVGYAKIEVRGGQSKVSVNVKKVYVGSSDIGVYLLSKEREILLGKIFIRNGSGEYRATFPAQNVDGAGLTMDQCFGLTIHDIESTWQAYTTIWEDAVAHAAEIELADVTSENQIKKEEGQRKREEEKQLKAAQVIAPASQILSDQPFNGALNENLYHRDNHYNHTQPPDASCVEASFAEEPFAEEAALKERAVEQLAEKEAELAAGQMAEMAEVEILPEPENPEVLAELERQEQEGINQQDIWYQFQCRQPKLKVFDYENGCEILSIKPQDIGLLPREVWIYGNNSFLLHGYYNHRHLILARLHNPQGKPRYLLGVPGHYYSNEKYMASMFGFGRFVLAKSQKENEGRFGYWYTDVQI